MIGQNFMIDLLAKQPAASQEIKKPEFSQTSYSQFNNVLSSAINKAPSDNNFVRKDTKLPEKTDSAVNGADSKPKFKAYREITQKDKPEEKVTETDSSSEETARKVEEADKGKNVKKTPKKDEAAVEALAQVMGIQPQDLTKVLESLNIKPEDLTDSSKTQAVVEKLSGLMNLTGGEKQTLTKIFDTLKAAIEQQSKKTEANIPEAKTSQNAIAATNTFKTASTEASDLAKLNDAQVSVVKGQDLQEALAKLKAGVEQLTQKLQQDPQDTLKGIASKIEEAVANLEVKPVTEETSESKKAADVSKAKDVTLEASKEEVKPIKAEEQTKSDSKGQSETKDNQTNEPKIVTAEVVQNIATKPDNGATLQLNNQLPNQVQKVEDVNAVGKLQKEAPVSKSEIINQVVEKAKVTLTGDKSEMSMDLKPDSLGKLALKVVTERGIVVAKFVAESQQVKETLEANMQVLKDSLEKQGLAVQGFSVSVQQDPHKGAGRQYETDSNKKQGLARMQASDAGTINAVSVLDTQNKVRAYNWGDSSINFTA